MGVPGNANALLLRSAAAAGGYQVERSLRFNSSDSAKCARTYSTGSSTTTQTFSAWVKRAKLGATGCFWSGYDGSAAYGAYFQFDSADTITVILGGASLYQLTTTQVFRDPSSWYHIVLTIDTNNGTSSDRIRLYVNGSRVTTFSTASYPTSGYACQFAMGNANNTIGTTWGSSGYSFFDGYLADIYFIDGQALTPSSFTEVSATTGQLIPKQYTGSFGTNGFWLKFSDNSAATATTLGKDYSGNGNNWSPSNLSVTAGAGNDSLVDTPTSGSQVDTGLGGQVTGNYATLNPLAGKGTLSNGNLDFATAAAGDNVRHATIGVGSGKWYFETTITSAVGDFTGVGLYGANVLGQVNPTPSRGYGSSGIKYSNGSNTSYGATFGNGDIIGCAFDVDSGKIWFSKNGTWQASGDPVAGTNATYTDLAGITWVPTIQGGNSMGAVAVNFGQRQWVYASPSGFRPLVDTLLPAPVVAKSSDYFQTVLYTGNGSTQTISGLGFSPDLVWIKARSTSSYNHFLLDTIRGVNNELNSNTTDYEYTRPAPGSLTAFNSDGFNLNTAIGVNANSTTYAAWCWDAGSSTVTNTQGSITSSCRTNQSSGFSIVSYTAAYTGSARTVGHGLGVKPSLIILKNRSDGSANWRIYHSASGASLPLILNSTAAAASNFGIWNDTEPTSSVFTVGINTDVGGNIGSGDNLIAYCFSPVAGYSSFGSYTGNGSSDGPFVFCGFRPRWIMIKRTDSAVSWNLFDTARDSYNAAGLYLFPNLSNAESDGRSANGLDILSNGFKWRSSGSGENASGGTYIYFAVAESPFQYARAR